MTVYDAGKMIQGQNAVVFNKDKHTGPVSALDFNPFQQNLLASGASESEIFIWDLNKPQTPMTPGAKSQPPEDVRCVAWNRQVQHILATTFSQRCVVWDLRKNEPIIKVSDNTSRMRCKVVAWHPEVATQLCIGSEDDHAPVIQIWDLRQASSPLRTLEHHQRGVLGVAWCQRDSDLLLSCGKDNKILCWNPNSNIQGGEVVCELASSNQWSFDVTWCPRNPAVIATSSFDGKVSVYSLMGGQQQAQPTPAIADSFPGMESMQPPISAQQTPPNVTVQLKNPPKWLRKPCGASFGFGGKLVSFDYAPEAKQSGVYLSTVVTDPELVQRSLQLETTLKNANFVEFCDLKIADSNNKRDQQIWKFIKASYGQDPRLEFLDLLGLDPQRIGAHIATTKPANASSLNGGGQVEDLSNGLADLHGFTKSEELFDQISAKAVEAEASRKPFLIKTDESGAGMLSKALLTGNIPLAVQLCLEQDRYADALILAMNQDENLLQQVQQK